MGRYKRRKQEGKGLSEHRKRNGSKRKRKVIRRKVMKEKNEME
jgi:hypothetical protein